MGFDITTTEFQKSEEAKTLRDMAHAALDQLIDRMVGADTDGGSAIIQSTTEGCDEWRFKLVFFNYTDEKDCVWCNGTGVEGS